MSDAHKRSGVEIDQTELAAFAIKKPLHPEDAMVGEMRKKLAGICKEAIFL